MHYILFLFIVISINHASSSSSSSSLAAVSYNDHCSAIVPQSNPTVPTNRHHIPYLYTPHITGGNRILDWKPHNHTYYPFLSKYLALSILPLYYETNASSIRKIDGEMEVILPYKNGGPVGPIIQPFIRFQMTGFWSENTRKLCMVGSASWEVDTNSVITLNAVLKLKYASENDPTIYTGADAGILESTASANDPAYFDPISIFSFPLSRNYRYSLVQKEVDFDAVKTESLSLSSSKFCSAFGAGPTVVELEYATQCSREPRHCSPLGGFLPRFLFLRSIECSMELRKLRYTAKFQNMSHEVFDFGLDSVMVGEASWDEKNSHMFGVACRLMNQTTNFGDAVGDCSVRLRMWYPSTLTIRSDAKIAGQLWSTKTAKNSGYFRNISLPSSHENGVVRFKERRYEYTELDRVRESCPLNKSVKEGGTYPDAYSYFTRFPVSIASSKGQHLSWGNLSPVSVENNTVETLWTDMTLSADIVEVGVSAPVKRTNNSRSNISYKIDLSPYLDVGNSVWFHSLNASISHHQPAEITAEGVYDAETGELCMVGCTKLVVNSTYFSRDCEILVTMEFTRVNKKMGGFMKGAIRSTRAKQDPLYFEDLILQSEVYYEDVGEQSIWRMDMEIIMVVISNTLACIFAGLQIFHVKRNPEAPSLVSVVMLLILCAGQMIPLVLHQSNSTFGRLESNEVAVAVITMIPLLLQMRLLKLVWSAKQKEAWIGEKKVGAIYILGGILALYSVWGDLSSYCGVVVDGFLVPQILLNIFMGSAEKALCSPFIIGTCAIRLVPHAYNEYRAHNYPDYELNETYYYDNPASALYSTAWDVVISCGVVVLAVIVSVQQRQCARTRLI